MEPVRRREPEKKKKNYKSRTSKGTGDVGEWEREVCQSACQLSGNSIWSEREKPSAPHDLMKGLLLFLCNSFGSFFFFFLLALAAQPELQAGLETVPSCLALPVLHTGEGLRDDEGDTSGHFRDTPPIKAKQLHFF